MMQPIDWNQILTQLLTEGGRLAISAITGFIAAWITFRFSTKRDLLNLKAEVQAELDRTRLQKREEVVDGIWKKVRVAMEKSSAVTAMLKQYPDFNRLSEDETKEIIDSSRLTDSEKRRFYSANDRNKFYSDRSFWHDLSDARAALQDLNAFYLDNKLRISEDFSDAVSELIAAINDVFISYEIWKQAPEPELMKRAREETKVASQLAKETEELARAELDAIRT